MTKKSKDFSALLSEYQRRNIRVAATPAVIHLESVKGCPYSCAMCHYRQTKPRRISPELLKKIEPYFKDLEVLTIHGQGEPLFSDLDYFVEQAVEHDIVLHMNSTAFFMTRKIADQLLQARLSIRFSIHSGRPETYKKLMGHEFWRVRENISYLLDQTKDSGERHDFWCSFLVMKENLEEIEDFIHVAHDLGIKNIRFMDLNPNWQSFRGVRMSPEFTFKYLEQSNNKVISTFHRRFSRYQEVAKQLGVHIRGGTVPSRVVSSYQVKRLVNEAIDLMTGKKLFPLLKQHGSCMAPWFGQLVIRIDGSVILCCSTNYVLGNLNEASLEEIWNGQRMQKIREAFHKGYLPRNCGYCEGFSFNNYPRTSFRQLTGTRP
jgi:radical SAM protein with 4Fe4S-binding SPASM domain